MIFNTPSLYRKKIYQMLDNAFDCEWFFGNYDYNVKSFDTDCLEKTKFLSVKWLYRNSIYCVPGMLRLLFSSHYDKYILTGSTHNISVWVFALLKCIFFKKKRIYFWTHGCYGNESFFLGFLKRKLLKSATGVFLYGTYAKNILVKTGIDEEKLFVIHNSLDYDKQLTLRKNTLKECVYFDHFRNTNQTIIFIGRLTVVKKLDMLIYALDALKQKGHNYNLVFVGTGVQRPHLEKIVQQKSLEKNVWFFGECYDDAVNAKMIFNADVCVSPGNVGLTAIHSLMFGTPVITHDDFTKQMPEFEAIQTGKTGDFFEYDNVESLANTIHCWLKKNVSNREMIRQFCYNEIDSTWNPHYQMSVFTKVLEG